MPLKRPTVDPEQYQVPPEIEDEGKLVDSLTIYVEEKKRVEDELKQKMETEQAELLARTDFEESEVEDKVWAISTINTTGKIYVIHQAAGRWFRREMVSLMKKNMRELEMMDIDEMTDEVEAQYELFEKKFLALYSREIRK